MRRIGSRVFLVSAQRIGAFALHNSDHVGVAGADFDRVGERFLRQTRQPIIAGGVLRARAHRHLGARVVEDLQVLAILRV